MALQDNKAYGDTDVNGKVTVIIPTYNNAATIKMAVSSALEQGEAVDEVLIYDDCSTDNTREILGALSRDYHKMKIFLGKENRGAGVARRSLLSSARGEFIAFLDADDIWIEGKLNAQLEEMKRSGADICTTDMRVDNVKKGTAANLRPNTVKNLRGFWWQNPIPMSTAVVRTSVEGWRDMPTLRARQDYAYWIKLFSSNRQLIHVNVNQQLTIYRRTPHGLSGKVLSNVRNNYKMFRDEVGFGPILSTIRTAMNIVGKYWKEWAQQSK